MTLGYVLELGARLIGSLLLVRPEACYACYYFRAVPLGIAPDVDPHHIGQKPGSGVTSNREIKIHLHV